MLLEINDGNATSYNSTVMPVSDSQGSNQGEQKPEDAEPTQSGTNSNGGGEREGEGEGEKEKKDIKDFTAEDLKDMTPMENFTFEDVDPGDIILGQINYKTEDNIIVDGVHPVFGKLEKAKKLRMQPNIDGIPKLRNIRMSRILEGAKLYKMGNGDGEKPAVPEPMNVPQLIMKQEDIDDLTVAELIGLIRCGIVNIWMVGPAGSGKSTIAEMVAKILEIPFYEISCGLGTSASEFKGYKYPEREATPFQNFYKKKAIILLDEFTALDPAVAQVANACLANGRLETTTIDPDTGQNMVLRHEECVIIATSNTMGTGSSPMYVANNQLDGSTRDRFVGAILNVGYSEKYESTFDPTVVKFVNLVRECTEKHGIHRISSTRMIITGTKLKRYGYIDWAPRLLTDWTPRDLKVLAEHLQSTNLSNILAS